MIFDLESAVLADFGDQIVHFFAVTAEILYPPTALADQQMLVTGGRGDESLAARGLVNTLDQTQFFQLLNRAIDRHQTQFRIALAGQLVNL